MSDELVHVVVVEIDLAAAPNRSPKQILEEGEQTVVVRTKLADLFAEVEGRSPRATSCAPGCIDWHSVSLSASAPSISASWARRLANTF